VDRFVVSRGVGLEIPAITGVICQSFNYVNLCMDLVGFKWVSPTLAANAGSKVSPELKKKRNDMKKQIKTKAQTHVRN